MIPIAMTIAGSDSGGGAGIQADLKTFSALGVFGTSAITAITAQNTVGVDAVEVLSPEIVTAQIQSVMTDFPVAAAKTGMLANAAIISAVTRSVKEHRLARLIVDTVMVSKSGHRLLVPEAEEAMRSLLLPAAYVITPNIPEAEVLTGKKITSYEEMKLAAVQLHSLGAANVLMKGGHLNASESTDLLFDGKGFREFTAARVQTNSTHGTGCTLSAAITAYLALGENLAEACRKAKEYLTGALRNAQPIGHGHGPVNHFWSSPPRPLSS
jgi:hydroxymethylpyrimidine/phosphomethylpyrimidine kinase